MILPEAELVAALTRDRAAGKRIGFVAVSFDVLRIGDVRRIQAVAPRTDRLVVAVEDDGAAHVMTVDERAELVDSVRGVDYVIVCSAGRVETLASLFLPDERS